MDEAISVQLYGDGSRQARLRAEYIYCDHAKECSAYKEGLCFQVTTLFGIRCEYGRISRIDGGTKRSKMYAKLYSETKAKEQYGKLSYPYNAYIIRIGNDTLLAIPHVRIEDRNGKLYCSDPGFGCNRLYVSADKLTPENIYRICTYHPHAIMGGEITDYQKKIVPMFLCQLAQLFPEQYQTFTEAYPDYEIKPPDWVGRTAKLATCNRELEYKERCGVFRFDGDELVCDHYHSAFLPFGAKEAEIRIKVTDDMEVKITDNKQVTNQTVFK